jgi:UDPglucose 6-dehydrogenase
MGWMIYPEEQEKIFSEIEYFDHAIQALENADACLVLTEWPEFDRINEEFKVMKSRVIIEGRRILTGVEKEGICW